MREPLIVRCGVILVFLLGAMLNTLFAAPLPVTAATAHYIQQTDNSGNYTDRIGNQLRFNTGDDNTLLVDSITVRGNQLLSNRQADSIKVQRVIANNCGVTAGCNRNAANISGEKQFFQYPYSGSPLSHDLKSARAFSVEDVYLSNAINIAVDNPMSNLDNNIERLDIIFTSGIASPSALGARLLTGFMISERWGNNPHQIAAIRSLDNNGNPTSYYPLSKANISSYGNTRFTITHSDGSITGPAVFSPPSHRYRNQDAPVAGGLAGSKTNPLNGLPEFFQSTTQPVRSAFHSFEQLVIPAGATVYGFSLLGIDVTESMDLVNLSDVPLNTDHIIEDSADIFGSIATLFVPGDQAIVGIAKRVVAQTEIQPGVFDVELELKAENLSSDTVARNLQVTDDLISAFAGADSIIIQTRPNIGSLTHPPAAFNGSEQINLLSGTDSLAPGAAVLIRFTVRVDIGSSSGVYENTAIVTTANTPAGDPLSTDLSDDGTVTDSNGDGRPDGPGEDDPTLIALGDAGLISVEKSVGKTQVSVGEIVSYSLLIRNNASTTTQNVEVQDTLPQGFTYIEESAVLIRSGADGRLGTGDDIRQAIVPTGTTVKIFGPFALAGREQVQINYLLRVGAGVTPGMHENLAIPLLADDPVGPQSVAGVEVVRDSTFDQSTIIGTVFHDRDGDGYQDDVNASNIRLQILAVEDLLEVSQATFLADDLQSVTGDFTQGYRIANMAGREFFSQSAQQRQIQLLIPLKKGVNEEQLQLGRVTIETAEGAWLEGPVLGTDRTEDKRGEVAKGVNAQHLEYSSKVESTDKGKLLVITLLNQAIVEAGIPGVRLATVEGLVMETDAYGRYHLADVDYLERGRGSQFIIKVDPKTLAEGASFSTENPRVLRITSSVLNRINFGVQLPKQLIPVTNVETRVPAHTEIQDQLHIDFSTHFIENAIDPIEFESGKSVISEKTIQSLATIVEQLDDKENIQIQATGHTDTVPLGPALAAVVGDNQGLSEARAKAVAKVIANDQHLNDIDVITLGKSYHQPLASNATESGRARNRRVEVQIIYDKSIKKWVKIPVEVAEHTVIEKRPLIDGGALWATEDPSISDPHLNIDSRRTTTVDEQGRLLSPLHFFVYSNYRHFIKNWELRVYSPHDRSLTNAHILASGSELNTSTPIVISDLSALGKVKISDQLSYQLRVFDEQGNWDETSARYISIAEPSNLQAPTDVEISDNLIGSNGLAIQSIPIRGSRVRVFGAAISPQYSLSLDGETLQTDGGGGLVTEQYLPMGDHQLNLNYADQQGVSWQRKIEVDVRGDYLFMVGLANLTLGGNRAQGAIEAIAEDDQFDDNSYLNARGAFYLKGKIKGKYLVTAQLDTREDEFKNWDEQLKRKDRTSLFRQLDPDRYYPVYGDDSTTYSDVDSQGAFYVRIDWDKSRALWGNFNTDITANEFAQYNRSLYGAQLVYRTPQLTEYGEYKNLLSGFVSEAQSASAHDEFNATGGSLYYLKKTNVVVGSEKLWIEIREENSTQLVERYPLRVGVDYDVDYFQGRLILAQPLSQIARRKAPSIIQDAPLRGDNVLLLADYEYIPDNFSFDNTVAGVRGKTWIADSLGIGATVIDEQRDGEDYQLEGVDLTWQVGKGTYLKGEFAQSKANQAASRFTSGDGGLTFQSTAQQGVDGRKGEAVGLEGRLDLTEFSDGRQNGEIKVWRKDRDQDFSSSRDDRAIGTVDQGLQARWQVNNKLQVAVRSKKFEQINIDTNINHSAQLDAQMGEKLGVGLELQRSEHSFAGSADEDATLAGAKLSYAIGPQTQLFTKLQTVLDSTQAYQANELITLGVTSRVSDRLSLGGEAISGDRGRGFVLETDYTISDKTSINVAAGFGDGIDSQLTANYLLDNGLNLYGSFTRSTADNNQEKSTFTLGQRKKFGNALAVYAENQFSDADNQSGLTHVFGVDYGVNEFVNLAFSLQKSTLEQRQGEDISRNAATIGLQYKRDKFRVSSKLEYRRDRSELNLTQWLSANALEWKQNRDYRWMGRLNYSVSKNDDSNKDEARFSEVGLGFAYRPATNDRLNLLTRLSYIFDLPSAGQEPGATDERSWVIATEGAYAVTPRWELGGKFANKKGEVRQQRDSGPWFDSTIRFYAARVRYHLIRGWDGLAEYRWLQTVQDKSVKSGALLALYKHIGEHVKLGGGFNFTDFNDDLTHLDYDNRGWFIDITAKY